MTGSPRVLVVEDEVEVARLYAEWLADDYDVETVSDGRAALTAVSDAVDVVLLDRRMPRLGGDETLERIRSRGYNVRVAMVTAVDPELDVVGLPFDTYLTKPVSQASLRTAVETLVELATYDEAVREAFALAEKRAVLTAANHKTELVDDDRFRQLESSLSEAQAAAVDSLGEMDHETAATALSGLSAAVEARHGTSSR